MLSCLDMESGPLNNFASLSNESLKRVRRHVSFVSLWNESLCYYPEAFKPNSSEMCRFVQNNPSCSYFVYYIDYLKLLFCNLNLTWNSGYVFIVSFIFLAQFGILYMIMKYFCLPNYMTLMELLPISQYTYSFVYFGICLFIPEYLSTWLTCLYQDSYVASLDFSKSVGDVLRFFIVGMLGLSINGYHVLGLLWWGNMSLIFVGFIYLIWLVRLKYENFGCDDLAFDDSHLLRMNAWTFLCIFFLVLLLVILVSYNNMRRQTNKQSNIELDDSPHFQDFPSDENLTEKSPKRKDFSRFKIWWHTVNGYTNMTERSKIIVIIFLPFYFILANVIPVIHKKRPMNGWCKSVVCISFLGLPFTFIGMKPVPRVWFAVFICSWGISFLVFITTHALREPSYLWLSVYCIVGMTMCSVSMHCVMQEIDNLIWQYLSMRFRPIPDMITLMFFNSGEMLSMITLLSYLIHYKLHDAAYGAVMSIVTHTVYMALPKLVLHECYNTNIYIACTSKTETCYTFFFVIFFGTLFHVSMSGNEFRMSLFFYLGILVAAYLCFQMMTYNNWVQHFGTIDKIKAPNDARGMWV